MVFRKGKPYFPDIRGLAWAHLWHINRYPSKKLHKAKKGSEVCGLTGHGKWDAKEREKTGYLACFNVGTKIKNEPYTSL